MTAKQAIWVKTLVKSDFFFGEFINLDEIYEKICIAEHVRAFPIAGFFCQSGSIGRIW